MVVISDSSQVTCFSSTKKKKSSVWMGVEFQMPLGEEQQNLPKGDETHHGGGIW